MPTTQPAGSVPATAAEPAGQRRAAVPDADHAVERAVPILPSADLDRALACYAYLGFRPLGRTRDYLRLARGPIELHVYLDPGLEPVSNASGCYLRLSDPAALRDTWRRDGVACLDVPGSGPYGTTLFAVVDADGNTLRIGPLADA
ncbi:MAG: VOC family protein [Actinocrinis sp.]